jgi:hypothetical protein
MDLKKETLRSHHYAIEVTSRNWKVFYAVRDQPEDSYR